MIWIRNLFVALLFGAVQAEAQFDFTIVSEMAATNSGSHSYIQGWVTSDVSYFPLTEYNWNFSSGISAGTTAGINVPLGSVHPPGTYKLVVGFASQNFSENVSATIGDATLSLVYVSTTWQTLGNFTSSVSFSNIVLTVTKTAPLGSLQNYWFAGAGIMGTNYEFIQPGVNRWADLSAVTTAAVDNFSSGNLVPNSSFELGFPNGGWTSGRNGSVGNECWLANMISHDAYDGSQAAVIGDGPGASRYQIVSPPIWLRGDRTVRRYNLSFYYKRGPGGPDSATVEWFRPYGSSDSGSAFFTPTASWQRFQTSLNLAPSPNRIFQFDIHHIAPGPLLIDAVQFEESTNGASAYAPADPVEVGLSMGRNGNVLDVSEPRNVQVMVYNSTGFSSNVVFSYVCYDWMNRKVAAGSTNYLADPGVSVNTLQLMTTNNGSQRMYGWLEGSPSFRSELEFSIIPVPVNSATNAASIFGTHGITGYGIMASNVAWGLSWQRGLSPGGIVQWNEIEPSEGNFTFTSTDAKVASCADKAIIFANLTDVSDIPSWAMTNGVPRLDRLSNYVFQAVTHFKNQIHYWEDINEPSTAFSVDSYALMLSQTAGAVKTADPTAFFVAFGGLGESVGIGWGQSIWGLLSPETKSQIDAVSVHMYPGNPSLWMAADDDPKMDLAASFGAFCGKPVWHTESGSYHWSGHGDKNGGLQGTPSYAEHNEEDAFRRSIWQTPELASRNWIRALGAGASRYFYYDGRVAGYGYAREDSNPTWWEDDDALSPLGAAYLWSSYFLDYPSSISQAINGLADARGFLFAHTNGAQVIAAFSLSRSNYLGTVTNGNFAVYDLMGNLIQTNLTAVRLGRLPTYWVSQTLSATQLRNTFVFAAMAPARDVTAPAVSIDVSAHGQITPSKQLPLRFRWTAVDDWEVNTDDTPLLVQTRYRFNGMTDWSPWSAKRSVEITSLPTNSTFLEVQTRDADGNIGSESGPSFGPEVFGLPLITTQPSSVIAPLGSAASFSIAAADALSYQWRYNGVAIPAATDSSYAIANVQAADAGEYDVLVSNNTGARSSAVAVLSATPSAVLFNGSFEAGYQGWSAGGNQALSSRSSDGRSAVQFNAGETAANGVLSQSFTAVPGQTYLLAFDVGADYGAPSIPQNLQVILNGKSTLLSRIVTVFGPGNGSSAYFYTNFPFIADSPVLTLTFTDVSPTGSGIDLLLDNVRLLAANPSLICSISSSTSPSAGGTANGSGVFNIGSSVGLTAQANPGYTFLCWTENGVPVSESADFKFIAGVDRNLVANFVPLYSITTLAAPILGGTTDGGGTFNSGSNVTVVASPGPNYAFVYWTEGPNIVSSSTRYSFAASANRTLIANFVPTYAISTTASPLVAGATFGGGTFLTGANVTVTAVPNPGFAFHNWTENGNEVSTSSSYTFDAATQRDLVANFVPTYTITASVSPVGSGTATGSGVFNNGSSVTLAATPNSGYAFVNWTENGTIVSTTPSYGFIAAADRSLTANFVATSAISVTTSPLAGGTISGGGIFNAGVSVTLAAIANPGYAFLDWTESDAVVSTASTYSFNASGNRTLVAHFVGVYTISAGAAPATGGTITGEGTFNEGSAVTLLATPNARYAFETWTENGSVVGTLQSYSFTVVSNRSLVANFSQELPPRMTFMRTDTNTIVLAWTAASTGYALWESPAPESGNWILSTNEISSNGPLHEVIVPVGDKNRFYRLTSQ